MKVPLIKEKDCKHSVRYTLNTAVLSKEEIDSSPVESVYVRRAYLSTLGPTPPTILVLELSPEVKP